MKIDWRYRGSQDNLHGYSLLSGEIGISDDLLIPSMPPSWVEVTTQSNLLLRLQILPFGSYQQ
jgi:hypothetical protein